MSETESEQNVPATTAEDEAKPVEKPAAVRRSRAKQGPRREFLVDRLSRHRMWVVSMNLKRDANGTISDETVAAVNRFAREYVLQIAGLDLKKGVVHLRASKNGLEWAFSRPDARGRVTDVRMVVTTVDGVRYRSVVGTPAVPDYLHGHVTSFRGFDTRPKARAVRVPARVAAPAASKPQAATPGRAELGA
jgi:hypothetical protein